MNTEPESESQDGGHFHDPEWECSHVMGAFAERAVNGRWSIRVAVCPHLTAGEVLQAIRLIDASLEETMVEARRRLAEGN